MNVNIVVDFDLFFIQITFCCNSMKAAVSCVALQDSRVVPIGRSPRTDVLLKAEKEVLEVGGCVLRLAGLYISYIKHFLFNLRFC